MKVAGLDKKELTELLKVCERVYDAAAILRPHKFVLLIFIA